MGCFQRKTSTMLYKIPTGLSLTLTAKQVFFMKVTGRSTTVKNTPHVQEVVALNPVGC